MKQLAQPGQTSLLLQWHGAAQSASQPVCNGAGAGVVQLGGLANSWAWYITADGERGGEDSSAGGIGGLTGVIASMGGGQVAYQETDSVLVHLTDFHPLQVAHQARSVMASWAVTSRTDDLPIFQPMQGHR